MKNTNNITNNETAQMMTVEAFMGALLIITALLFVVSQAPSGVQQADAQSKTQLMHYGEDTIDLLKNSPPPLDKPDYDNKLQYYLSENKFDDLNEFLNDTLPDNVAYNVELYDGGRYFPIIRNGYPSGNGISFNEIIVTKRAPAGGVGHLTGTSITYMSFDNGSLIIPMDEKQNNNITAYNLILKISNLGIPVYQLLQDPRGNESAGFMNWSLPILTSTDPWNGSDEPDTRPYAGGPYVIDVADLTSILKNQIRGWAENPIEVPSSKIDMIEFNSSMEGKNIHITFTLNNGSTKIINLTAGTPNITSVDGLDSLNDSEYLHIDTTSVAYDDLNKSKIIGIVIFNQASFDLTISNITVESVGKKLSSITINGTNYPATQNKVKIDGGLTLAHDSPSEKVIIHNSSEEIKYSHTTWLTGSPRIAVYPEAGTMTNYFSDSGISYTVLDSYNIINGNLGNYDILIVPHTEMIEDSLSDVIVVRNVIGWVSDGGVLLAECASIKEIDDRVEEVDLDNHTWHGFIGISGHYNDTNGIQLISPLKGVTTVKKYINLSESDGARLHPLAQSYTEDGTLPGTNGTVSAFSLNITENGFNPNNIIMAVPQNYDGDDVAYPKITFVEAPFDKGTVIYLAGHDQSTFSQQRERLIFNSILYSTTAKVYSYGLLEIRITMWYK
jgi:hypothetical protein